MMKRHTTLLLILCAIMQVGCTKAEKKETFKQGDLQTWKISDGLIFKGYLGERRKHIPEKFDAQFYFPNSEKFIGQFPIDYIPKPFDKVSHEEAKQGFNDNLSGEPQLFSNKKRSLFIQINFWSLKCLLLKMIFTVVN